MEPYLVEYFGGEQYNALEKEENTICNLIAKSYLSTFVDSMEVIDLFQEALDNGNKVMHLAIYDIIKLQNDII